MRMNTEVSKQKPTAEKTTAHRGTLDQKTLDDLSTAMRGEAFAYAKYLLYAEHARKSGNKELADLFEKTANTELWFAKTLADCKINRIAAAVSPVFCYNFSHVALCQSLFRNGGSPVARATKSAYRESRFASTTRRDQTAASAVTARSPR